MAEDIALGFTPAAVAPAEAVAGDRPRLSAPDRRAVLLYCSVLIVVLNFISPATGFHVIPISFILKNKLHLSASELATFTLWAGIPAYFSFAFGMVRDNWSPFGLGDRGYLILFGLASAVTLTVFAFVDVSLPMLLAFALLGTIFFLFMWGAWNGLGSVIGQQFAMSGQISALWNFAGMATIFAALLVAGFLSDRLEGLDANHAIRILFLAVAAAMLGIAVIGLWRPQAVYGHLVREAGPRRDVLGDLLRLLRHQPVYPALACWLFWNFSPGGSTVLQYYMSDVLHASDAQWGAYNAIFSLSFLPTFALFGWLSPRYSLSKLLWWGTIVAVPQMIPLLFIHSPAGVLVAAVPIGLMGGVANAAFMDLLIRSCPKGLEGTMMMMAWSMYALATNFGNLLGTALYEHGGFFICVAVTTLVYAAILPMILFVPKRLIAMPDGVAQDGV